VIWSFVGETGAQLRGDLTQLSGLDNNGSEPLKPFP